MKTKLLSVVAITAFVWLTGSTFAELSAMPQPTKEHEWLKKFAGEWETVTEISMEPGKPPLKATGSETAKMDRRILGGGRKQGRDDGAALQRRDDLRL